MKLSIAAILAVVGLAAAQGPPDGCTDSYNGPFEVAIVNAAQKRDVAIPVQKRDCGTTPSVLVATLNDGVLTDAEGRTGYIASNYQFQFDHPPQAGAIITSGFSVCGNNSLALGSSAVFYQCLSGSFYNLYDRSWAAQCQPVYINIITCDAADPPAGQAGDGQVVGTTLVATTVVTVLSDGQPQAVPTEVPIPLCQIGDGQVQAHTVPCASIPAATPTVQPVSQISDGQIQVPPPSAPAPAASAPAAPSAAPSAPSAEASPTPSAAVSAPSASAPVPIGTAPSASAPSTQASAPPHIAGAPKVASSISALAVGVVAIMWLI